MGSAFFPRDFPIDSGILLPTGVKKSGRFPVGIKSRFRLEFWPGSIRIRSPMDKRQIN
jgi:hypothetical protein